MKKKKIMSYIQHNINIKIIININHNLKKVKVSEFQVLKINILNKKG